MQSTSIKTRKHQAIFISVALISKVLVMTNPIESAAATEPANVLFLGDSIAVGVGASSPKARFSTVLIRRLNETGDRLFTEINMAVSGSTLAQSGYPVVLPRAIAGKPDIFIIQHGVNDNAVGNSLGEYLWAYRETVQAVKKALPDAKIVCMTICPSWGHYHSDPAWINQANIGIQEIAALEHTLVAHVALKLRNRRELFPDGIHPNDEGHRLMAEAVFESIRSNKPQTREAFDFVANGPRTYRICQYVMRAKTDSSDGSDGWIEIRGLSLNGFSYRSDYQLDITTPFESWDAKWKVLLTSGTNAMKIVSSRLARGQGFISLPASQDTAHIKIIRP